MSVSVTVRSPSMPAPILGLFSDGFAGRPPSRAALPFAHACDPSHRFLFSVPDDWYGRWNVLPWRPALDAAPVSIPVEDIVVLAPVRAAPAAGPSRAPTARRHPAARPGRRARRPLAALQALATALGRRLAAGPFGRPSLGAVAAK